MSQQVLDNLKITKNEKLVKVCLHSYKAVKNFLQFDDFFQKILNSRLLNCLEFSIQYLLDHPVEEMRNIAEVKRNEKG